MSMTITNKPIPSRTTKSAAEIEAALTKALKAHPECHGVKFLKVAPLENSEDGLANWDAEYAAEPGVTMSAECKRLTLSVKQGVQKHFDLASGDRGSA
jgi:hypothetical protein